MSTEVAYHDVRSDATEDDFVFGMRSIGRSFDYMAMQNPAEKSTCSSEQGESLSFLWLLPTFSLS